MSVGRATRTTSSVARCAAEFGGQVGTEQSIDRAPALSGGDAVEREETGVDAVHLTPFARRSDARCRTTAALSMSIAVCGPVMRRTWSPSGCRETVGQRLGERGLGGRRPRRSRPSRRRRAPRGCSRTDAPTSSDPASTATARRDPNARRRGAPVVGRRRRRGRVSVMNALDEPAIVQFEPAAESIGQRRAVRHDDQHRLLGAMQRDQQVGDDFRRRAIEIASGFVADDAGRAAYQRARDARPAGARRPRVRPADDRAASEAHVLQQLPGARTAPPPSPWRDQCRRQHVVERRQLRQQQVVLKTKPICCRGTRPARLRGAPYGSVPSSVTVPASAGSSAPRSRATCSCRSRTAP